MGRTSPSNSIQLNIERNALTNFRRALRTEDQMVFDDLWVDATKHLMVVNQANRLMAYCGREKPNQFQDGEWKRLTRASIKSTTPTRVLFLGLYNER